jgi:hypothetical protein
VRLRARPRTGLAADNDTHLFAILAVSMAPAVLDASQRVKPVESPSYAATR